MENFEEFLRETSILMTDVASLVECFYATFEMYLMEGKSCACLLPLSEIIKDKTNQLDDNFDLINDEFYRKLN